MKLICRSHVRSGEFTYIMEGMKYLNKTVLDANIDMLANLDKWKFTFRENYLSINDLKLNFSGMLQCRVMISRLIFSSKPPDII